MHDVGPSVLQNGRAWLVGMLAPGRGWPLSMEQPHSVAAAHVQHASSERGRPSVSPRAHVIMLFSHAICPPPLLSPGRPYPLPPNPHRGLTLLCAWPHSLRMAHPLPAPKVAIPRIGPFAPPQDRSSSTGKPKPPRTDRACDSCRKRKIRCSGEQPHCQSCLNQLHPCVYPQARKDRLKE